MRNKYILAKFIFKYIQAGSLHSTRVCLPNLCFFVGLWDQVLTNKTLMDKLSRTRMMALLVCKNVERYVICLASRKWNNDINNNNMNTTVIWGENLN